MHAFVIILVLFLICAPWCIASTSLELLHSLAADASVVQTSPFQPLVLNDLNKTFPNEGVFVGSGELQGGQMGNWLSKYFEVMACSDITRIHFLYRPVIKGDEQAVKFFSAFPQVRQHPNPIVTNYYLLGYEWRKACPAAHPYPHKWAGAWNQRPALIAEVVHTAIKAVYPNVATVTVPSSSFSNVVYAKGTVDDLPLVPSAAILFRCVDILHLGAGNLYGFINFNVYAQLIPRDASTIYILTEPLNYLDRSDHNQRHCKDIGEFLVTFLHNHFPSATVALRRGYPIDSVAVMANTPTLISPPSTFSLYPSIANPNNVYFMPGGLYRHKPFLHKKFKWITYPTMILPGAQVDVTSDDAVEKIKKLFTAPLTKPVMAAVGPV